LSSVGRFLGNVTGGLSGPAIKPVAVRMVYQAAAVVSIPIIGAGGIMSAEDVVEFLMAGATAVQIGTAHFAEPRAIPRILDDLRRWLERHGVKGRARTDWSGAGELGLGSLYGDSFFSSCNFGSHNNQMRNDPISGLWLETCNRADLYAFAVRQVRYS